MTRFSALLLCLLAFGPVGASAQSGFVTRYQARAVATQVNQPRWATPLVTVNARIEQQFRTDFVRQTSSSGQQTWNLGGSKGFQFIPLPRTEIRISPPPFLMHYQGKSIDGFGDMSFRGKFRLYGSNEQHHNAIATAILGASIPTGKNANGSCCAILTPALDIGKGIGNLVLVTSIGGSLPVSNPAKLGRSIVWNNSLQYHLTKLVWVQSEFNSTFYKGGPNDGKQQTFITPDLVISRIPLIHGAAGKQDVLGLTIGVGEQIALTHFHTYNHAPVFTLRLKF